MAEEDSFSEVPDEISVFENVLVEEDSFDLPVITYINVYWMFRKAS